MYDLTFSLQHVHTCVLPSPFRKRKLRLKEVKSRPLGRSSRGQAGLERSGSQPGVSPTQHRHPVSRRVEWRGWHAAGREGLGLRRGRGHRRPLGQAFRSRGECGDGEPQLGMDCLGLNPPDSSAPGRVLPASLSSPTMIKEEDSSLR